jgi:hypothetical protein
MGEGTSIRPPRRSDADGQGVPLRHLFCSAKAMVEVDLALGRSGQRIVAACMMSARRSIRSWSRTEKGIAQGPAALMGEYLPGRTENLHDYLIPTAATCPRSR